MKRLQLIFAAWVLLFYSVASYAAYDTLGATVLYANGTSKPATGTRFAIWNPDNITPASVWVQLPGGSNFTEYPLTAMPQYNDNGVNPYTDVYSVTVPQNCNLCQYYFTFNGTVVRDPYAKMTTGYVTDTSNINDLSNPESQFVNTGTLTNPIPAVCSKNSPPIPGPSTQVVVDLSTLNTPNFNANRPALAKLTDAIVYELEVRDYTTNPDVGTGVTNPGTFTALAQSGTCNGQSTGLQHLKDLGITHIQIMPMYTFSFTGYSYNWGYNPLEYNVPQEVFSKYFNGNTAFYTSAEYTGRIQELQNMVNAYHQNGLRVVMDVVFNHTYGGSVFSPNSPVSNAYYITSPSAVTSNNPGGYEDYTGCGNTVNVSNPMVSNMFADSLAYWMAIYGVDGYRFDEMATFPYPIVSSWAQYLNNLNPGQNYIYYGEPWNDAWGKPSNGCNTGNISSTEYMNNGILTPGVGCFNGPYRCALIGPTQGAPSTTTSTLGGYIFNESPNMQQIGWGYNGSIRLSGTTTNSVPPDFNNSNAFPYANMPSEAINYVCCHDGLCIWDKICAQEAFYNGQAQSWSNQYLQQIDMFSLGIIMTSQGVAFFAEGDEFLRTKDGNANSYNAPLTTNWISWSAKSTNLNVFKYYQKLIALRKNNPAFTQGTLTDITNNSKVNTSADPGEYPINNGGVLIGQLNDSSGNQFIVIYNSASDYTYEIGSGSWMLLTNINDTGITSIQPGQYPAVGTVFNQADNVLCCGTSVTVLANMANPTKPVANPL